MAIVILLSRGCGHERKEERTVEVRRISLTPGTNETVVEWNVAACPAETSFAVTIALNEGLFVHGILSASNSYSTICNSLTVSSG